MELDRPYSEFGLVALSSAYLRKGVVERKMIGTLLTSFAPPKRQDDEIFILNAAPHAAILHRAWPDVTPSNIKRMLV